MPFERHILILTSKSGKVLSGQIWLRSRNKFKNWHVEIRENTLSFLWFPRDKDIFINKYYSLITPDGVEDFRSLCQHGFADGVHFQFASWMAKEIVDYWAKAFRDWEIRTDGIKHPIK